VDVALAVGIVVVLAFGVVAGSYAWRRRTPQDPVPRLATDSADRTMINVRPANVRGDATVIDVRVPTAPAATPSNESPTVVVGSQRADATAPTIRVPRTLPRLTITRGGSGRFDLEQRDYVVGRSTQADIHVEDPSVSGRHARITVSATGVEITDLGSTNGTSVNDQRVQGPRPVRPGDILGVGDARLRVDEVS
jgi:FHA domain-containing protein